MDEEFELPVHHKGKDLLLPATLQISAYSHRILVNLNEKIVIFEPDEERNYRAFLQDPEAVTDTQLVQAVIAAIEHLFK